MLIRLQTASAVLLLVLASAFGHVGILQCLCSGQVTFGAGLVEACEDSCCNKHREVPQRQREDLPSPCDDGSCYLLITLDATDPPASSTTAPVAVALCPAPVTPVGDSFPRDLVEVRSLRHQPPDRGTVPLTVLFSSFLI